MKKFLNINNILCIIAFLGIFFIAPLSTYAFQIEESFFMQDITGHWAEESITELTYMGVLKGDGKNSNPDKMVTRAEFMAMLVRALDYKKSDIKGRVSFSDVKPEDWYYETVAIAEEKGITKGNPDGTFSPNKKISREEIVLVLVRAMGLQDKTSSGASNFRDIKKDYPYKAQIDAAVSSGIISGYEDNTFRPNNYALRAEAAIMISRMLNNKDVQNVNDEKKDIQQFIQEYMNSYLESKNAGKNEFSFNMQYSVGKELDENNVKSQAIDLFNEKGINVRETHQNIQIRIDTVSRYTAKATVRYDVTYTRTFDKGANRVKDYKGEKIIYLWKLSDGWKIYDTESRLYQDKKINLTWEQVAVKTPDMSGVDPMEGLNVISPTWFELRSDKSSLGVKSSDPQVFNNRQGSIYMVDMGDNKYIQWAHKNGYDVWGLFRNEFDIDVANKVLNDSNSRRKIIELLIEYTKKYQLDGINVDFENVYYSDRHKLSQMVREMAVVLRELGVITSVDVTKIEPTSLNWSMCYDRRALGKAADYVVLMAYDQNGSWSKKSGSVAQYSWVESGLKEVLEQVPREELLLGLPLYTRLWEEQNGKVVKTTAISMQTAQDLVRQNNANIYWDNQSGQYIASYSINNKSYKIWMEDTKSIGLKASLVHKYSLAGVASWRRGFETPDIWPVLNKTLNGYDGYEDWLKDNTAK
ncbi:MAG: hypothetical protein GX066_02400 [Clostridiaceae bacterium]|nr:hypothetical protein [Clostridiaceae bacterium]